MSTLTKVFIVLLVVFSIAFTMSVISYAVQTTNWRQTADDYKKDAQVAETHMRNLTASHAASMATWWDVKRDLDSHINELESKNQQMTQDLGRLNSELAAVRAEKSSDEALARMLGGELKIAQAGWVEQRKQREGLESRNMELERRNADLNERVKEQADQNIVLEQEKRQLEQQVNILKTENEKLAQASRRPAAELSQEGTAVPGVVPLTESLGSPIRGRILDVEGNRATISVGSADGVEAGMVFVIYRGSSYVGDLEITDVEPNRAAGRTSRLQGAPRAGDQVADEARFGAME